MEAARKSVVASVAASPRLQPGGQPARRIAALPGGSERPVGVSGRRGGFSLVEILVTVGLLSFIVLGLLAMFNQTQRAFRSSMTQTDLLEGARATTDLLARDLEEMTPSRQGDTLINGNTWRCTNFLAELEGRFYPNPSVPPFEQPLPGSNVPRTNVVQRFFFLAKENQDWLGIGYRVAPNPNVTNVGTLYRIVFTNARSAPITLTSNYYNVPLSNYSRIADGIVHLRVKTFATNGYPIFGNGSFPSPSNPTNAFFKTSPYNSVWSAVREACTTPNTLFPDQMAGIYFWDAAVPAYVEIEIGFLEDRTLARLRGIPTFEAQAQYLRNHAAQVHIFHQRIPIRNVDPSGY